MAKGKNLRRLAEVLNCRPGWLLGEEDNEYAGVLGRGRTPYGKDTWHRRALNAEKKLADLRSGLRYLLETSGDLPHQQDKVAAGSLAVSEAAAALKRAQDLEDFRAHG